MYEITFKLKELACNLNSSLLRKKVNKEIILSKQRWLRMEKINADYLSRFANCDVAHLKK